MAAAALCGGALMVLLQLTSSGARRQPSSEEQPEADDRDDVVDSRGVQGLPSSPLTPAAAIKTVWATRRPLGGNDYHCDDSDGMGTDACQIRCGAPCLEPFRLCMAHESCHVVALNHEGSFATLKTSLPGRATWYGAAPCKNVKEWRAWLGKTVGGRERLSGMAPLERSAFGARAISLALGPVRSGQDFKCAESDGSMFSACQIRCESKDCTEAWQRCVTSPSCAVVQMNAEWTWGTLKTAGGGATLASVRNESDWRVLRQPQALVIREPFAPYPWPTALPPTCHVPSSMP